MHVYFDIVRLLIGKTKLGAVEAASFVSFIDGIVGNFKNNADE